MDNAIPPDKLKCHRTGFTKSCKKLVVDGHCNRWVGLVGQDANTGEDINAYNCLDNWGLKMGLEQAQQMRQLGGAMESFRNEVMALNGFPDGHPRLSHTNLSHTEQPKRIGHNGNKN